MLQSKTRSKDLKTQNTQVCILKAVGAISKVNNALLELKNSADLNTTTLSKYTSTMVPDCTDSLALPSHVRSNRPEVLVKKVLLEISQNSQENTCPRVSFLMKKETLA